MIGFIELEAVGPGWGFGQEGKKKLTVKRSLFNVQVMAIALAPFTSVSGHID